MRGSCGRRGRSGEAWPDRAMHSDLRELHQPSLPKPLELRGDAPGSLGRWAGAGQLERSWCGGLSFPWRVRGPRLWPDSRLRSLPHGPQLSPDSFLQPADMEASPLRARRRPQGWPGRELPVTPGVRRMQGFRLQMRQRATMAKQGGSFTFRPTPPSDALRPADRCIRTGSTGSRRGCRDWGAHAPTHVPAPGLGPTPQAGLPAGWCWRLAGGGSWHRGPHSQPLLRSRCWYKRSRGAVRPPRAWARGALRGSSSRGQGSGAETPEKLKPVSPQPPVPQFLSNSPAARLRC